MRDQGFSAKNFRLISETEKRKGNVRDQDFFPSVKAKTDALRERIGDTKDFRRKRKGKYSAEDQAIFDELRQLREEARKERDGMLLRELEAVAREISRRSFKIDLFKKNGPGGKDIFVPQEDSAATYYALKKLSENLSTVYKVSPANRNETVSTLIGFLSDGFPYHIVRTDIANFFESIPHDKLLEKIRDDQLLSQTSVRLIGQILHAHDRLSGSHGVGLPRGIGLSSYLSELFMRDIDSEIMRHPEVVFYARYVDDIVMLWSAPPQADCRHHLSLVKDIVQKKGLTLNVSKTFASPVDGNGRPLPKDNWAFEYLGYNFTFQRNLAVQLSDRKKQKYLGRLNACFSSYEKQRARNQKAAFRLLVKRIRFLTGNTQLTHNKSNAYVGLFFSNSHLSNTKDLRQLDGELRRLTATLSSPNLRSRLNSLSFVSGFEERIFRRFHRKNEFSMITQAWKYE